MKLVGYDGGRVGILEGDGIVDITDFAGIDADFYPPVQMVRLIAGWDRAAVEAALLEREAVPLASVRLDPPLRWPNKLVAFPANYHAHIAEMGDKLISRTSAKGQGFFLKANSSISGPADPVALPPVAGREIHHEGELGIIIGRGGRNIAAADAADHIFGFTCLMDIVIRGQEERVMRKSFDSFCPIGPAIVTADAVPDWDDLTLVLTVDGEERQRASTRDLIVGIGEMVAMASSVMTLEPGDIIASGTPAGVGPIVPGNRVELVIDHVGTLSVPVEASPIGDHMVWHVDAAAKEIA